MKTIEEILEMLDEDMRVATETLSQLIWTNMKTFEEKCSMEFNRLIAKDCE